MRLRLLSLLALAALLSGCGTASAKKPGPRDAGRARVEVAPPTAITGRVASVNTNARFAVLNFPVGWMPAVDRRLSVYRRGQKVGEVRVTGPQRDLNTVADLVAGEAQAGDEVREQ
jgi:hypothetical protein